LKRQGRKSAAQTPAPAKERIYGSKKNPKGSAASKSAASKITLSEGIVDTLKNKADNFNDKYPSKDVSVNTLKAVMRRGMGAYSTSHRPTISGGRPNSRQAWGFARVNKFLEKKAGKPVKKAYVQDDDLLAQGGELKLIAPNGKPSNLTPEQYKLVRSPQFKAWFGDWENDPKNASKVVDENGEPLVVYHGTYAKDKFNIIDFNKADLGFHFVTYEQAKDRSQTRIAIKDYKQYIEPFFLNIRELFVINDAIEFEYPQSYMGDLRERNIISEEEINENGLNGLTIKKSNEIIRNLLIEKYENVGFKYENKLEGEGYSYIVCQPNQIKLADGTNTTFDPNNPDIRYKKGGETMDNIALPDSYSTYESLKPILKNQGYELIKEKMGNELPVGKLAKGMTVSEVASVHGLTAEDIKDELAKGIETEMEHTDTKEIARAIALDHLYEDPNYYTKLKNMEKSFKKGGEINPDDSSVKNAILHKSGNSGGLLVGNRHSEGGIKAINKSSNQPIEMEGGEVVITRNAVSDQTKREFEGEMLTNREILSRINESGGGVSFAKGGDVPSSCSCSGKTYKYGGKLMKDFDIVNMISGNPQDRRKALENFYASIQEDDSFMQGGEIGGLEDLSDCAREFLVDMKESGKNFMEFSRGKKDQIQELVDGNLIYVTDSGLVSCLTANLTSQGKKFMSSVPKHLFKKGGVTDCGCGCGSYKEGGNVEMVNTYFKGVSHDYENQFDINKAIEELLAAKDSSELTIEEKNFLTYYSGYGGLEKFGASGKGLLYEYFTPSLIAKKMWALAYKHGFEEGMVLEPSCGIGEFIKYAPEQALVTGYEINATSAKIAKILYPEANIVLEPFEKIFIKNNYTIKDKLTGLNRYSLVIGNPPYGSMGGLYAGMGEKDYAKAINYIDYFILRGLDLLKSGGILVYVIGTEVAAGGKPFLQQGITENKKLIAQRAELVDAYRLPNGVFERTDVLTDIVVFKKK